MKVYIVSEVFKFYYKDTYFLDREVIGVYASKELALEDMKDLIKSKYHVEFVIKELPLITSLNDVYRI